MGNPISPIHDLARWLLSIEAVDGAYNMDVCVRVIHRSEGVVRGEAQCSTENGIYKDEVACLELQGVVLTPNAKLLKLKRDVENIKESVELSQKLLAEAQKAYDKQYQKVNADFIASR